MMKIVLLLVFRSIALFVITSSSCSSVVINNRVSDDLLNDTNRTSHNGFNRLEANRVVYATVLSRIHNNTLGEEARQLDGITPLDLLVYRHRTVGPRSITYLSANLNIPNELTTAFSIENSVSSDLESRYEVLAPISVRADDAPLREFLSNSIHEIPDTKAVVAFSNVAYKEDHEEALVYFEYIGPNQIEKRMFVRLFLDKYQPNTEFDEIVGVDRVFAIAVK